MKYTSPCDSPSSVLFRLYFFWAHKISGQGACQCCLFFRGVLIYAIAREMFHYLPAQYDIAFLITFLLVPVFYAKVP